MAAPHVYFSRQMLKAKYKDPKTNEYRDYVHSRATGKDGKPLLMYRILLPSANHRNFQFEKDVKKTTQKELSKEINKNVEHKPKKSDPDLER